MVPEALLPPLFAHEVTAPNAPPTAYRSKSPPMLCPTTVSLVKLGWAAMTPLISWASRWPHTSMPSTGHQQ